MILKIAINGFGRIGRCLLRAYWENFDIYSQYFTINALNLNANPNNTIHYLEFDSIYGKFNKKLHYDEQSIYVEDQKIQLINERNPSNIDWSGIDIVAECTGKFNKHELAKQHIHEDVQHVIVSAPVNNADLTVIYGVNHQNINWQKHQIISSSSCTSNCLLPIVDLLNKSFAIEYGNFTTIHSCTNDQRILDGSHKDLRRARAGGLSIIPTSTGASNTVNQLIPELSGKFTGKALRVPTLAVSSIDLVVNLQKSSNLEELYDLLMNSSQRQLCNVLQIMKKPLVSADFIGNPHSCIVDWEYTKFINDYTVNLLLWYDNEWAFAMRMLDNIVSLIKSRNDNF